MGIRHVFHYEYRKLRSEHTFWIVSALLALFLSAAFLNGYSWREFQERTIGQIERKETEQMDHYLLHMREYRDALVGFDHPGNAQGVNTGKQAYFTKKPHPNAIYLIGQSDLYPFYFRTSPLYGESLIYNHEILNPLNLLIGKIDFGFVVLYLLPLLAIAVSYDLRSVEIELGTARLVHTYNKSGMDRLLLHKLLFRMLWFGSVLLICSLGFLLLFSRENLRGTHLAEFGMAMLSSIGYMAFWFALAFFANSFGRSSLINGIVLVSAWIVLVFMLPSMLNAWIVRTVTLPSRNQQIIEAREMNDRYTAMRDSLYRKMVGENPGYILPTSDTVNNMVIYSWYPPVVAANIALKRELDRTEARFRTAIGGRDSTLARWRFASPSLVFGTQMNDLSRNGRHHFSIARSDYERFRESWSAFAFEKVFRYEAFGEEDLLAQEKFKKHSPQYKRAAFVYVLEYLYLYFLALGFVVLGVAVGRRAQL